jgi:hypothetical protein
MKGIMYVWINILLALFIFGLAYTIFSWILFGQIATRFYSQIAAIDSTASGINQTVLSNTITVTNLVWYCVPLIFLFLLFIYGILASQKQNYDTYM